MISYSGEMMNKGTNRNTVILFIFFLCFAHNLHAMEKNCLAQMLEGISDLARATLFATCGERLVKTKYGKTLAGKHVKDLGIPYIGYGYASKRAPRAFVSGRKRFSQCLQTIFCCGQKQDPVPDLVIEEEEKEEEKQELNNVLEAAKSTGKGVLCATCAVGTNALGKKFAEQPELFVDQSSAEFLKDAGITDGFNWNQRIDTLRFLEYSLVYFSQAGSHMIKACKHCCGKRKEKEE